MILNSLAIRQFRNLDHLELDWNESFNVIWGRNAQGKTNILEAIYLLGQLKSFRQSRGSELIQHGEHQAKLTGQIKRDDVIHKLELHVHVNGRTPRINGKTVQRLSQYLGHLRAVLFTPEELGIVRGYPAGRRALLDRAVLQSDPTYLERVQEYERILRQRNQLLKDQATATELDSWSEALANMGGRIRSDRLQYISRLRPHLKEVYRNITQQTEEVDIEYSVAVANTGQLVGQLADALKDQAQRERQLGQTLSGPHRDDLNLYIDRLPLKTFGSQGQQRSFLLAYKAAQVIEQEGTLGEAPLLLLDDLASELDRERQSGFVEFLLERNMQVFITTASPADLTDAVRRQADYFYVDHGKVDRISPE